MNKLQCRCMSRKLCLLMHMNFATDTAHTPYIHICLHVHLQHYHGGRSTFEIDTPMITCVQKGEGMTYFNAHNKVSG